MLHAWLASSLYAHAAVKTIEAATDLRITDLRITATRLAAILRAEGKPQRARPKT